MKIKFFGSSIEDPLPRTKSISFRRLAHFLICVMESRSKRQCVDEDESVSLYFDACKRIIGPEMEKRFNALVSSGRTEEWVALDGIMPKEDIERCRTRFQTISEGRKLVLFRFFRIAKALRKQLTYEDVLLLHYADVAFERFSWIIDLPEDGNCETRFLSGWFMQFFGIHK